jgi:predicted permease
MIQILALVLPLFALILIGYVAGRSARLPIDGLAWLNFFILYVALPALFFRLLAAAPIEEFANTEFIIKATFGTFSVYAACFIVALLFSKEGAGAAAIQGLAGAYGNIGYLGPPLAIAAFGPGAVVPVALIFCIDNAMHFTTTPLIMAISGPTKQHPLKLLGGILKKIFTHPFILATIAGVGAAWLRLEIPQPVDGFLNTLASAAAPCALFAMGVTAALRPLKRIPGSLLYLVPAKLLIHPLVVFLLLSTVDGLDAVWLYSAVLLAALPTATNVYVLAQQYDVWTERASSCVVVSTMISIVTITLFLYLARGALAA